MTTMEAVEVAGLMRRMNWHAGKARLLEIEDARRGESLSEIHVRFTTWYGPGIVGGSDPE